MNLHAIVRPVIGAVNPNRIVTWIRSTGYTTNAAGARTPSTAPGVNVDAQIQAMTARDLQHKDLQNIQGVMRAVYLFGNVAGVIRADKKGGDLLQFSQNLGETVQTWLAVAILETWTPDTAGWCKVAVLLQNE
jgi:hypothetical protein